MSKTQNLSITMPIELVEKLRKDASENYRSLSSEIAFIVDRYFFELEKKESAN